ncbi:MAG: hypothetical protein JO265_13335 [Acidimicrobiia bacterium]|nr:hypothetical protein [Acidimicrobiia bacterium]
MRIRSVLVLAVLAVPSLPWATAGGSAAAVVPPPACVVTITRFAFRPSTAPENAAVTLRLEVQNCTPQPQRLGLTRFGTEPPGCPVIDPITKTVTIRAHSTYRERTPMTAPPCVGTEQITERVSDQTGKQLAQATADLTVTG